MSGLTDKSDHLLRSDELVQRMLDGSLDDAGVEKLTELLAADTQVVTKLVRGAVLHETLRRHYQDVQADSHAAKLLANLGMELESVPEPCPQSVAAGAVKLTDASCSLEGLELQRAASPGLKSWLPAMFSGMAIAASLFIAFYLIAGSNSEDFAMITQVVDAGSSDLRVGTRLGQGERIELHQGQIEITFDNGTQVAIKGPADFEVLSSMKARAEQGRITVDVGHDINGFTIETPSADVVDWGTTFGVGVEPDETDVVVFDGIVDLHARDGAGALGQPKRLTQGEALRVSSGGKLRRIMSVLSSAYPIPNSLCVSNFQPVIAAVQDNLRDNNTSKCYRIVHAGFQEDAVAYVDRDHQWNGLTDSGLPRFLIGGDYIMPFNNDKRNQRLRVSVTFASDANVYVLYDQRVDPPIWLSDQFEDTGIVVGLDEGPSRYLPNIHVELGPGRSIDNRFCVWKGGASAGETLRLGPLEDESPENPGIAMYGIVATSLEN